MSGTLTLRSEIGCHSALGTHMATAVQARAPPAATTSVGLAQTVVGLLICPLSACASAAVARASAAAARLSPCSLPDGLLRSQEAVGAAPLRVL